ncbi:lysozyme g isoform X2 [Labrus bergylta]|uniref:lysozyme g n=1 Tax=Labrus bergylta TaxID=56723 RepID=UPI003313ECE6
MGGNSSSSSEEEDDDGYGNIMDVRATGASKETARQDRLLYSGEEASHKMAEYDLDRMKQYKSKIKSAADKYDIDPALIAAIISRESRAGNTIKSTGGWGDYDQSRRAYNAFGLMQVDVNPKGGGHKPRGAWDSKEHLCQATGILVDFIEKIRDKFPDWSKERQLKGAIAAYNCGDRKVDSYREVDKNTTGKDYSNDVVERAKWYKRNADF